MRKTFNPTLVWFQQAIETATKEQRRHQLSIPPWSDFNFIVVSFSDLCIIPSFNPTLVWFQPISYQFVPPYPYPFNPTLVWFQPQSPLKESQPLKNFQSHLGLISTQFSGFKWWSVNFLSIPPWSDFNSLPLYWRSLRHISFNPTLVWFQQNCVISSVFHSFLSIPPWSDFNRSLTDQSGIFQNPFNPTLVWFQQ